MIKKIVKLFKPKKTYTPAEIFALDKPRKIDSNIAPENLMISVSKRAQEFGNGEKQSKKFRKRLGQPTKYDIAEDRVFDICSYLSNQIYSKPDKLLAVFRKSEETKESLIKVYYLLNSFKKETSKSLEFAIQDYTNDLKVDYHMRDRFLNQLNQFILFVEMNESTIKEALEMEELAEERIESTLERIRWLFYLDKETFSEEMDKRN